VARAPRADAGQATARADACGLVRSLAVVTLARWSVAVVLVLVAFAVSPVAGHAQTPELERWLDGSQPLSFGVDTSRFRVSTLGTKPSIGTEDPAISSVPYRLVDSDLLGTAMSFDLKMRWPSSSGSGASALGSLAPYLSFGPTLLVPGAEGVSRPGQPVGRNDGSMAFGLSWGAGLSWRFAHNAELFGSYRFMQFGRDSLSHGDRPFSDSELSGHDFLYGISVRF
jgi:opacity protein-like surface antigen